MDASVTRTIIGLAIPLAGTTAGAAMVFLMRGRLNHTVDRALTGFAAGVMVAASVWSLIVPAIEESSAMGRLAWVPAFVGFWLGILFLLLLDSLLPHLHLGEKDDRPEGLKSNLQRKTLMLLAVTIHNIPEGMAVGVVYAGLLSGGTGLTAAGALALSVGIAIQNFPEGAIISMPLHAEGSSRTRAFLGGFLSGVVEPAGALLTILAARQLVPLMPYLLSFAGGAHPRDERGRALQRGRARVRARLHAHDGARRGPGLGPPRARSRLHSKGPACTWVRRGASSCRAGVATSWPCPGWRRR